MKSTVTLIVASAAFLITFLVARRILRTELNLSPPRLLAALIIGLAFLGLATAGEGVAGALLLPYAALAIVLDILLLLFWISRLVKVRTNRGQTPDDGISRNSKLAYNRATDLAPPSDRSDTTASAPATASRGRAASAQGENPTPP
ncbi:MAG: hypothetical protein ACLQU3_09050 [Limisphaerales bacterium]